MAAATPPDADADADELAVAAGLAALVLELLLEEHAASMAAVVSTAAGAAQRLQVRVILGIPPSAGH